MKRTLLALALAAAVIGWMDTAHAQEIAKRKENQQHRIANGVQNGSLTPHETANLERKETALNRETRRDRARNGGNLTNRQKVRINHQQNRLSRNIDRDKHNAARQ